ncbi:hypothetical protein KS726_001163 [Salmonella enterica]|nr:hypothetical protein [Salmonella enterica]
MQIMKRRSDAIYLTEMGAFIARRIIGDFRRQLIGQLKETLQKSKSSPEK